MNFILKKIGYFCIRSTLFTDFMSVQSWANPADAPSRFVSLISWKQKLPKHLPPIHSCVFLQLQAHTEEKLLLEPLSEEALVHAKRLQAQDPIRCVLPFTKSALSSHSPAPVDVCRVPLLRA